MISMGKADDCGCVVLVSFGNLNEKTVKDPIGTLLLIWCATKEINHGNLCLADQEIVQLLGGVDGCPTLKINVLGESLFGLKEDKSDRPKQQKRETGYHLPIIRTSA
jgi:hypothetical protein